MPPILVDRNGLLKADRLKAVGLDRADRAKRVGRVRGRGVFSIGPLVARREGTEAERDPGSAGSAPLQGPPFGPA